MPVFQAAGLEFLKNEHRVVTRNGAKSSSPA